jgi:hypothetical protein
MIGKYYKASSDENSLCHSRSHMYIKREGTPGHYRYYYNTDTTESASSDSKVSDEYRNELSYNSQKNSFPKSSSSTTSEKVKENFSKSPSQAANDFINRKKFNHRKKYIYKHSKRFEDKR